jgi:hypothetical protein
LPEDSQHMRSPLEESRYYRSRSADRSMSREDGYYYDDWAPRGRGRGRGWGPWDYGYSCPPPGWGSRDPYYDPHQSWRSYSDASWYDFRPPGYTDLDDPLQHTGDMGDGAPSGDYEDAGGDCPDDRAEQPDVQENDDTGGTIPKDDASIVEQGAGPVPESEEDYLKVHKGNYAPETGPALLTSLTSHLNTIWQRGRDPTLMKKFYEDHPKPEGTPF